MFSLPFYFSNLLLTFSHVLVDELGHLFLVLLEQVLLLEHHQTLEVCYQNHQPEQVLVPQVPQAEPKSAVE
jgi:hypothetical protein